MVALVNAKQSQEVRGHGVRGGASLPFPEGGVEVVAAAQDGTLPNVKGARDAVELEQPSCKLEVGV